MPTKPAILFVEDQRDWAILIQKACAFAGIPPDQYHIAVDAFEAIRFLQGAKGSMCGCVVTDIDMPVVDGLQLLAQIRADAVYASLPVFILSSWSSAEQMERAQALGCERFIEKPSRFNALIELVRDAHRRSTEHARFPGEAHERCRKSAQG